MMLQRAPWCRPRDASASPHAKNPTRGSTARALRKALAAASCARASPTQVPVDAPLTSTCCAPLANGVPEVLTGWDRFRPLSQSQYAALRRVYRHCRHALDAGQSRTAMDLTIRIRPGDLSPLRLFLFVQVVSRMRCRRTNAGLTYLSSMVQISVQALEDPGMFSVSSFKLNLEPKASASTPLDIAEQSKMNLDALFHPGGEAQPSQPWFAVKVTGCSSLRLNSPSQVVIWTRRLLMPRCLTLN